MGLTTGASLTMAHVICFLLSGHAVAAQHPDATTVQKHGTGRRLVIGYFPNHAAWQLFFALMVKAHDSEPYPYWWFAQ